MSGTTTSISTLADRLRAETADLHAAAEATTFQRAMGRGAISREQYVRYLCQLRWIHQAIEDRQSEAVRSTPALTPFVRAELNKVGLIGEDLRFLNGKLSCAQPLAATGRVVDTIRRDCDEAPIRLIGHIYVLEGSTNGGRFMAVSLQHSLGLVPPQGLRYMDPYGTAQRSMWARFRADLDAAPLSRAEQDGVVEAAKSMFRGITDVLEALEDEVTPKPSAHAALPDRT